MSRFHIFNLCQNLCENNYKTKKKNSHFNKYLIWQADPREDSEPQTLNQGLASLPAPPCEPAHPLPGPISPHRPLSLGYSTYQFHLATHI